MGHSSLFDQIDSLITQIVALQSNEEDADKLDHYLDKVNEYFQHVSNLSREEKYLYKDMFEQLDNALDNITTKLSLEQTEIRNQINHINITIKAQKAYV